MAFFSQVICHQLQLLLLSLKLIQASFWCQIRWYHQCLVKIYWPHPHHMFMSHQLQLLVLHPFHIKVTIVVSQYMQFSWGLYVQQNYAFICSHNVYKNFLLKDLYQKSKRSTLLKCTLKSVHFLYQWAHYTCLVYIFWVYRYVWN